MIQLRHCGKRPDVLHLFPTQRDMRYGKGVNKITEVYDADLASPPQR